MKRPNPPKWFSYAALAIVASGVLAVGIGRTIEYSEAPAAQITQTVTPPNSIKYQGTKTERPPGLPSSMPVYTSTPSPPLQNQPNTGYATPAPSSTKKTVKPTPTPTSTPTRSSITPTPTPASSSPTPEPGSGSPSPSSTSVPPGYTSGDPIPTNTGFQTGDRG
jgi:hypothetical protein